MALKYVGGGKWITHIPAKDLSDEEVKQYAAEQGLSTTQFEGLMIERGLYKLVEPSKQAKAKTEVKDDE